MGGDEKRAQSRRMRTGGVTAVWTYRYRVDASVRTWVRGQAFQSSGAGEPAALRGLLIQISISISAPDFHLLELSDVGGPRQSRGAETKMTERLKGKRILVTAAAQGIGRSTVEVSLHTKTRNARRERRVCESETNVNTK